MGIHKTNEDLVHRLKSIVHPYQFVLKEGAKNEEDLLDYSLMMVQVGAPETIPAPDNSSRPQSHKTRIPLPMAQKSLDVFKSR